MAVAATYVIEFPAEHSEKNRSFVLHRNDYRILHFPAIPAVKIDMASRSLPYSFDIYISNIPITAIQPWIKRSPIAPVAIVSPVAIRLPEVIKKLY